MLSQDSRLALSKICFNRKGGLKMFNIYYMNYNKAFEIATLTNNEVIDFEERENTSESREKKGKKGDITTDANVNVPWLTKFKVAVNAGLSSEKETSNIQRMRSNVQIIQSNSILLNAVLEIIKDEGFSETKTNEGTLVKIDNISLEIKNEEDVRAAKMLQPGTITDIKDLNIDGMSINPDMLMTSMISDYFYILTGTSSHGYFDNKKFMLKIPLADKFQSSYSIDDLLIGKVSIVGIYKGIITEKNLSNTFNFFKTIGEKNEREENDVIESSTYRQKPRKKPISNGIDEEYLFIDTIAVLQNVIISEIGEDNG